MSVLHAQPRAFLRRRATVALAAAVLAGGALVIAPGLDPAARIAVPAGAVLEATAGGPQADRLDALVAATPAPAPTPSPTAGPTVTPSRSAQALAEAPALGGDGPLPPDPRTLTGYRWPLPRGRITQPFGQSPAGAVVVHGVRFHDGLDLATFCGDHVVAAHAGLVVAAGRQFDSWMGWIGSLSPHIRKMNRENRWYTLPIVVVIDDGNGYRSIYAHFNAIAVRAGQRVTAGQFLGWEGQTGFATGCHLHYGLFSPFEANRFELRPDVRRRTRYPRWEIARIDPLRVLPAQIHPAEPIAPSPRPGP